MKAALVPILSGVALAIMAGASINHYISVRQMVTLARIAAPDGLATDPARQTRLVQDSGGGARTAIESLMRQNASLQQVLASNEATLASIETRPVPEASDPDLKRLLTELVAQNRYLRDQIAETNRDVMELQFRVDTHSEQFRPLKLNEDESLRPLDSDGYDIGQDVYDTSIGVLPPLDVR